MTNTNSNAEFNRPVNVSLAAFGSLFTDSALNEAVYRTPSDVIFGKLATEHIQLCPQNRGTLTRDKLALWQSYFSDVQFRLHANVRIEKKHHFIDLKDWRTEPWYFKRIQELSEYLDAPVYSAHAGKRVAGGATEQDVIKYSKEATQQFGVPVAIEGHYPTQHNAWLFDSWEAYRLLLESGAYFALDLSHLNVLAVQSGIREEQLTQELLSSDKCVEVHLSSNDGSHDQHLAFTEKPWWYELLHFTNPEATFFYEGLAPALYI